MTKKTALNLVQKHMAGKHPQKSHGKGGGSSSGSGGGGKAVRSGVEKILGRAFNPDTSKTIGSRTSNLMNFMFTDNGHKKKLTKELDAHFKAAGLTKYPGMKKSQTVWGNKDRSTIVNITQRSRSRSRSKLPPAKSMLVEVITKD